MLLNSIDTNRLTRNLSIITQDIEDQNKPVVVTRFKRASAVLFPLHFNTKTEAWMVRAVCVKPNEFRRLLSNIMRNMAIYDRNNFQHYITTLCTFMKPFAKQKDGVVLIPYKKALSIIGEDIQWSDVHYKPLPFTDNRSNR